MTRKKYGAASLKQLKYLQEEGVDLIFFGGARGSGKSHSTLVKTMKYIGDKDARIVILRETVPLLKIPGGLLEESHKMYPEFGGVFNAQTRKWRFPSGCVIQFSPFPNKPEDWKGMQATHIFVDEADNIEIDFLLFLFSCLRSATYKGKRYINLTFNPNPDTFLMEFVDWCLEGDFGIPATGTEDITRYWVYVGAKLYVGNSEEEVRGKLAADGRRTDTAMMTYKFIPATIYDNPVLMKNDPGYLAFLENMPTVNRARFLLGAWKARIEGEGFFRRSWCEIVDHPPAVATARVRAWDLAASVVSESQKNPDWTAGVLMSRDRFGIYYIEDVSRFRLQTDGVIREIVKTARYDGEDTRVIVPRDPGGAGKIAASFLLRTLAEQGVGAKSDPVSGHTGKLNAFKPFCALAESGNLRIVKGEWNNAFFEELEGFTSDRQKQRLRKDDQVDAASSAFNTISKTLSIPDFVLPDMTQSSPLPRL